jgi:3',5'-cyclic-AMP phosphodiesterase
VNWFLLDSLEETNVTPGFLGKNQLEWLATTLDAHPDTPALVMVHHNPGVTGNTGLKDTVPFFEIIRPRKQVKAYIYGHTHAWSVDRDDTGLHLINLPPVAYVFTDAAPAGWVHARTEPEALHLTLHCIDKSHRLNGQQMQLPYRTA